MNAKYIIDENVYLKQDLFEEMDPYIPLEYFATNNKAVFIIDTNSKGKLNDNDIVKEI